MDFALESFKSQDHSLFFVVFLSSIFLFVFVDSCFVNVWLSGKESCLSMQEIQEMQVWSLGLLGPLEKEMAMHSSILAWKIPWTEEPGGLQSLGVTESDTSKHTHMYGYNCCLVNKSQQYFPGVTRNPCFCFIWWIWALITWQEKRQTEVKLKYVTFLFL